MDQDHASDLFRYIGVTFLGAAIQWLFTRMRRMRRSAPSQPVSAAILVMGDIDKRFSEISEQLTEILTMLRSHGSRLSDLEKRRAAGAD